MGRPTGGAAIEAEDLAKSFGTVRALDGVSFSLPQGSVLGLLGPNGAGKTTVVRILTTVLRADRGRAQVAQFDVASAPQQVRRSIGLAGQYAAIDENLTGRENLALVGRLCHLGKSQAYQRASALLDQFRLGDAADRPARTYSGGMRRRLDLAAALVNRPPIVLLDEPTTGLDPASRQDLWEVISNLVTDGASVLLTTQYLEEADRLADNIVLVDHGQVIAEGTPAELKKTLGETRLVLHFARPGDASAARAALSGYDAAGGDNTIEVGLRGGARTIRDILNRLGDAQLEPGRLELAEPTLDDVFMHLTKGRE